MLSAFVNIWLDLCIYGQKIFQHRFLFGINCLSLKTQMIHEVWPELKRYTYLDNYHLWVSKFYKHHYLTIINYIFEVAKIYGNTMIEQVLIRLFLTPFPTINPDLLSLQHWMTQVSNIFTKLWYVKKHCG